MIQIRRAEDRERPAIAALHAASWKGAYADVLPASLLDEELDGIMARRWAEQPVGPGDALLVAEDGESLAGFCATWDGESAYIDNLHVRSDARSGGIGRRLLAETARHFLALGRRRAHLHVLVSNARARALYVSLGGRPAGIEEKDLYGTRLPNERIEWDDLSVLLERAEGGPRQAEPTSL